MVSIVTNLVERLDVESKGSLECSSTLSVDAPLSKNHNRIAGVLHPNPERAY